MIDKERISELVKRINSTSNADFVKRLLDGKRKTLKNADGTVSTHELGYVTEGDGAVVFPNVQSAGDSLIRLRYPESYERAVEGGDTVHMSVPDAELFTKNYKGYYPGFDLYACGGKKYPDGGRFFRTNLQQESPLMYQPMMPSVPNVPVPVRYEPQPHYGLYEYPSTTGLAENYPITVPREVAAPMVSVAQPIADNVAEDLFSEEAMARRALKQRYAESNFDNRAKSHAGAMGAWQIMPITYKDYLGRGRGKAGDLNDPEYNRKVRDWVMGIIPRDLQEFWSDSDSDRAKLAKLYAAYNWGAGNLRGFLRKKQKAGVDISNPDNWVDDLNPETRRYVKYLAFDEDIPDSTVYTNAAFEKAAADRGFAGGGRIHIKPENRGKFNALLKRTGKSASWFKEHGTPLQRKRATFALNARKWKHGDGGLIKNYFEDGGPERQNWFTRATLGAMMAENPAVATASGWTRDADGNVVQTDQDNPGVQQLRNNLAVLAGTSYAAPLLSAAPVAINWLSNPANQIVASKFAVPLLGGAAVEEGVRSYTPYSGVGNLLYNAPTVPWSNWSPAYSQARRGAPQWERDLTEGLLGFANPGYFVSPELMAPAMDKVMTGIANDFRTHIAEPVKRGGRYARDWYDFVVRGNNAGYKSALNNVMKLAGEEDALARVLAGYEDAAARYPQYSLAVRDASVNVGDAAGSSMKVYPSEMMYGSDRIPMVVEDIGVDGNTKVTYLRSVPESEKPWMLPQEYDEILFTANRGPYNRIYRDPMIGDEYVSPLTGNTRRSPSSVLEKPEPARGNQFISSGGDDELVERYGKEVTGGSHIPVQRGEASGAAKIAKHIEEDVMPLVGDDVALTGSSVLYKNGILSGKPGDYEFLVAEEDLPALTSKLKMSGSYDNGFAVEGNSPLLRSGSGPHNVDAQVVRMDKYGEANGKVAWSLFKTMHPADYEAQATNSIGLNKDFYQMRIVNPSTGLPYKPKELITEFKNGNYETQHVINEAMAISKQYNKAPAGSFPGTEKGALDLLKQDRALSLLTNKDPQVKAMVRKAIDDNARTSLGENYIHGHDFFPGLDFENVENNKEFLKYLDINPKGIADDPEVMRNMFDQWFLVRTSRYREVSNMSNLAGVKRAVGTGNVPMGGGSATASGRNTVTGGYYGGTVGDPQRGMFQQMPTYRTEMSDLSDMKDVVNMFKRTEEGYKFTPREAKELNDELVSIFTDMQNDMSLREGGIGRNGAKNILQELKNNPIRTLSELDEFFNKGRGVLKRNGLSDMTSSDIIQRVSERLDIPEFLATGRWNYQHKYAGIWNRNAPRAASYRYVTDYDWKPFEVGRDFTDFGVRSNGKNGPESALSLSESHLLPDDESRAVMRAIYEGGIRGTDANTLIRAGAKPIYDGESTNALKAQLEEIQRVNELGAQKLGYLKRYSDMPFARRRIGNAEYETGLHYRSGRVSQHNERIGGRSVTSLSDEMLKTAPFDKRYGYITDIKPWDDGSYYVKAINDKAQEIDYIVTSSKSKKGAWEWKEPSAEDLLPFAKGGFLNRMKSVYGDDVDKIRQVIANVRTGRKK